MFVKVQSAAVLGLDCIEVTAEVDIAGRWPGYQIVGLADAAIQEAKERIRTAWKNSGLEFPSNARVVINLAPADVRKIGSAYDLPMAMGMYLATEGATIDIHDALFAGELALDGALRPISGVLPLAIFAKERGYTRLFIPTANAKEASIIAGICIYPVQSLRQLIFHLQGTESIQPITPLDLSSLLALNESALDMADIKGQQFAKRALEIAASGAHNVLLSGPPGSGKTLLSRTLPTILPQMTVDEAIEVTKMYSVAGLLPPDNPIITQRPFRAPHHSASTAALVGGGTFPKPGEISLSHRGILFLDEFPEFPRPVLEALRQPLEDGVVTISRAQGSIMFPAKFTLIASQNPCPCGYATDADKVCVCSPMHRARYQKKISGPLLDRIDLHVDVPRIDFEKLSDNSSAEPSAKIRARVEAARQIQQNRFANSTRITNSEMTNRDIKTYCQLNDESLDLLRQAVATLHLSARSYNRILKIGRTIADLEASPHILTKHVAEAIQYRPSSRQG
ncbi:MAG: magnesium chelatase [Candidatus Magasanikbacteria bacterium CG10_big_fil_rev_8_21_14_0_10_47_10]|uniref:Magnesium chelatase n=1 Tax=Candidatus Magasanikbacteria bacterium CG10_big_fil_rev_8_21_14_0_10_47_10 TaxID=1974652 RepID=A0A2H0TPP4_9BACT|nr:MAG: magnesium chelatase [Candidatus Magasanikbacteria bacterium CG10_big_fil_rev_8_21_14_0_10_47_10]